jgi:hypothetical protein
MLLANDIHYLTNLLSGATPGRMFLLLEERSLKELQGGTPKKIKGRAADIIPIIQTITRDGRYIYKTVTLANGNTHQCWVMSFPPDSKKPLRSMTQDVLVWCDCPYFTYHLEVALTQDNASVIAYSNGADPVVRNPGKRKYLCKHLYAVLRDIKDRVGGKEK